MANGDISVDTGQFDIADQLRRKQLLDQLQQQQQTDQQQANLASIPGSATYQPPSPFAGAANYQPSNYQPSLGQTPPQQPTPPQAPVAPPTQAAPKLPYPDLQAPDTTDTMTKDVSDLRKLAGQDPALRPQEFQQSKLKKYLMLPLIGLAGAGGKFSSSEVREAMNDITRKGYKQAESDYKRQLEAATAKYGLDKDQTKTLQDVFRDKLEANKAAMETWKVQTEAEAKKQEAEIKLKQLDIDRQSIPQLNQELELGKKAAEKEGREFTVADHNKIVEDNYTAQEKSRIDAETIRLNAAESQRQADDKIKRGEANVQADIRANQTRLDSEIIKPIQNARQNMTNLQTALAKNDADGISRYLDIIMLDNALANATHGSVRQNAGIIHDLIKTPGLLEYIKGKAQGILRPGRGDISDATMQQAKNLAQTMANQMDAESAHAVKNLIDLNRINPTDPDARDRLIEVIKDQYVIPKTTPFPSTPTTPKGDAKSKLDDIRKQADEVDAIIKKKLAAGQK